jgi:putative transposase
VESAHYVLACYRYIELNPVRADMVNHPAGYFWSSYAANSGGQNDPFVAEHPEFTALSGEAEKRQSAYRGLFDGTIDAALLQAIREATNGGLPLASDDFKKSVLAPMGWKIGPGKPGPRANSHPDPELVL